jgi:lipoprotein-anchoring transpeptidase ErfK/SrfK
MRRLAPVLLLLLAGCGAEPRAERPAPRSEPHFAVAGERARSAAPQGRWPTARVLRRTVLRAAPAGRPVGRLRPRTEFGSPKVVSVLRRRGGWLQVVVPERPNGRPGWIRAGAARHGAVDVSLHVDRSARRLTVRRGGRVLRRVRVAVGRPGTETPTGRFAVTDKLRTRRSDSPYGCCAVALSGHQPKLLPGWPGGDRLAIHATPQTETIGQAASLGCLRAATRDLRALLRIVPLGAPVFVRL